MFKVVDDISTRGNNMKTQDAAKVLATSTTLGGAAGYGVLATIGKAGLAIGGTAVCLNPITIGIGLGALLGGAFVAGNKSKGK